MDIEKKHTDIINIILSKSKYDLYYDNIDNENNNENNDDIDDNYIYDDSKAFINNQLLRLKNIGPITNYKLWKKLTQYLCNSNYNIIDQNEVYGELLIDLLDNKLDNKLEHNVLNKMINIYNVNAYRFLVKFCVRFGIYNAIHLMKLLEFNMNKPIKDIDLYFKNFIMSKNVTKEKFYFSESYFIRIILYIIFDKILLEQLYINNKFNDDMFDKFVIKFKNIIFRECDCNLYNKNDFDSFVQNNKIDFDSFVQNNKITNNKINLQNIYIIFIIHFINKIIDMININNNENNDKNNDENNNENNDIDDKYINIYNNIYNLHINIDNDIKKSLDINTKLLELETKFKLKLKYLNMKHYKKINKFYKKDNGFIEYILKLYENNRELINNDNYKEFANLDHYKKFINTENPDTKKILYNFYNELILNGEEIDATNLMNIGVDETIMKNAMYSHNSSIIRIMLDNKYNAKATDLCNIYHNFTDTQILFGAIDIIFKTYASYNIFMDKNVLTQFIRNNDFSSKFKFLTLKPYTIYKDDSDKEFNKIISEILAITKIEHNKSFVNNKYELSAINIKDTIKYVTDLEKNNKKITFDDIFKFSNCNCKFLLNKYIEQQKSEIEEKPKKIVKKVVKKIVKKVVKNSNSLNNDDSLNNDS
jgi:hypothetical protein